MKALLSESMRDMMPTMMSMFQSHNKSSLALPLQKQETFEDAFKDSQRSLSKIAESKESLHSAQPTQPQPADFAQLMMMVSNIQTKLDRIESSQKRLKEKDDTSAKSSNAYHSDKEKRSEKSPLRYKKSPIHSKDQDLRNSSSKKEGARTTIDPLG